MNGEFAVSAPGTYEAAGARFVYTRSAGLDKIFAMGPIQRSIDIMVTINHITIYLLTLLKYYKMYTQFYSRSYIRNQIRT